jgi:hypothetical protein
LGSWYGGYTGSDSWRMSSGITEVHDRGDYYDVVNHSGSVYQCVKGREGMSGYTSGIYQNFVDQLGGTGAAIQIVAL